MRFSEYKLIAMIICIMVSLAILEATVNPYYKESKTITKEVADPRNLIYEGESETFKVFALHKESIGIGGKPALLFTMQDEVDGRIESIMTIDENGVISVEGRVVAVSRRAVRVIRKARGQE